MRSKRCESAERPGGTWARGRTASWILASLLCFGAGVLGEEPATDELTEDQPVVDTEGSDSPETEPEDESVVSDREKVELVEDSDVSEALSRRPDLKFANVTIDGEKASVSLDEIPADQVEDAKVSKAATPDLDADNLGRGLNLRSRPAYELDEPVLSGSVETSFNPLIEKLKSKARLSYGRSMGPWGFMLTGTTTLGRHAQENYRQDWDRLASSEGSLFPVREQAVLHDQGRVVEHKVNGTIDIKSGEQIRIYLKGDAAVNDYEGYHPGLVYRYWRGEYGLTSGSVTEVEDATIERTLTGWESEQDTYSVANGGYFDFDRVQIDYVLSYNARDYVEPDWFVIGFVRDGADLTVDASDPAFPVVNLTDSHYFDLNDPREYGFDRVSSQLFGQDDREALGTLNARIPFTGDRLRGHVRAGLKHRSFRRRQISESDVYNGYDGTSDEGPFTLADVVADYDNPSAIDGRFDHGPMPDLHASREFLSGNLERFVYSLTESRLGSDPGTWTTEQDISAAYGLLYLTRGGLRMIAGVRVEQTDLSYEAEEVLLDESGEFAGANRLVDSNRYRNLFPGIHFRYDRGRFTYTGSWSNTILRPWYAMVVPFRLVSLRDELIDQGNPELRPTLLQNFNGAVDYRIGDKSTLSLELSVADMDDIVYYKVTRIESGPLQGFKLGTNQNGPSSAVESLRIIWDQALADLFPPLRSVFLNFDYTYSHSGTEYPGRPGVTLPVQWVAEHRFQSTLRYATESIFAQLHCSFRGEQLMGIYDEPWRDSYDFENFMVSFSGTYTITKDIRAFLDIHNLLSEAGRSYLGSPRRPSGYLWDPRRLTLGLRFEL